MLFRSEAGLPSAGPPVLSRRTRGDCDRGEVSELSRTGEGEPGEPREETDRLRRFRWRGVEEEGALGDLVERGRSSMTTCERVGGMGSKSVVMLSYVEWGKGKASSACCCSCSLL